MGNSDGAALWNGFNRISPHVSPQQESMPFAVVGSDKEYQVNGKRVLGRKTPWGIIEGKITSCFWEVKVSLQGPVIGEGPDNTSHGYLPILFAVNILKPNAMVCDAELLSLPWFFQGT